jgi:hypothetical protein
VSDAETAIKESFGLIGVSASDTDQQFYLATPIPAPNLWTLP